MSKKTVKISIAGSAGRMGKMLVNVVDQHVECELVAATCHPSEVDVIGKDAGTAITTGDRNTAVGHQAGDAVTTGGRNTLMGYKSGSALGVYLERYTEVLGYDCYSLCFGPPEESVIYLNSFGVRGLWMNHSGGKNRSFFKVNAKMGYILDYGSPYASVGISVGAY